MSRDILFKTEEFIFSYRVAGILIANNKILLQRPINDDYSFIGGHVTAMETTEETLIREFKEEIHADIIVDNLMAIGEIFFPWLNKPCHQISFYYKVHLRETATIPMGGIFKGYDELDEKKISLDFCWIPMAEIENVKIYPQELIPFILHNNNCSIFHFVSRQLS